MKFSEATPDQFREFFEKDGWTVSELASCCHKETKCKDSLFIYFDGAIGIGFLGMCNWRASALSDSFQSALDAANELAGTKIFGGWRE